MNTVAISGGRTLGPRARLAFLWLAPLLVVATLWPSVSTLWQLWLRISDYRFGIAVSAICIVWAYARIRAQPEGALVPQIRALPFLLLAIMGWCVSYLASSDMLQQLFLPPILLLTICAVAGVGVTKACFEPVACLYLGMPWWDYLLPALQKMTVFVTETLLAQVGIRASVQATFITIPEGTFEIAEGCAGKHYFTVAVTLGVLAGAYVRLNRRGRVVLVALSAALGLAMNWLRVLTVIVAGHLTNMQHYLVAKEHVTFGTVLFAVLIGILVVVIRILPRSLHQQQSSSAVISAPASGPAAPFAVGVASCALLFLAIPTAVVALSANASSHVALAGLPVLTGAWQGPLPPDPSWQPAFAGAAETRLVAYRSSMGTVQVYVAVYGSQRDGAELINFENRLLAPGVWRVQSTDRGAANTGLVLRSVTQDDRRWLVASAYRVGGHQLLSDVAAQLAYGGLRLFGTPAGGVVAVAVACGSDCESAHTLIDQFWQKNGQVLLDTIPTSYSPSDS